MPFLTLCFVSSKKSCLLETTNVSTLSGTYPSSRPSIPCKNSRVTLTKLPVYYTTRSTSGALPSTDSRRLPDLSLVISINVPLKRNKREISESPPEDGIRLVAIYSTIFAIHFLMPGSNQSFLSIFLKKPHVCQLVGLLPFTFNLQLSYHPDLYFENKIFLSRLYE